MASPPTPTPDPAEMRRRAASAFGRGDFGAAARLARAGLRARPSDPDLLGLLGASMTRVGFVHEGVAALEKAARLAPQNRSVIHHLARAYADAERPREAIALFDRILASDPADAPAAQLRARELLALGRVDEASGSLRAMIETHPADPGLAVAWCEATLASGRLDEGIAHARRVLGQPDLAGPARRAVGVRLARLLDRAGAHADAWGAATAAHAAFRPPEPDAAMDLAAVQRAWPPGHARTLPRASRPADRVALIVGMPRSGTTLTERIVAAHSRAAGIGESVLIPRFASEAGRRRPDQRAVDAMARAYHDAVRAIAGTGPRIVADKMPPNYLHLGLVARVLPGARVVNVRRDPRDVVVSCHFHDFATHPYIADPVRCARACLERDRIVDYWRRETDLEILDLDYQDLAREPEPTTRRLLAFLGLDFEPGCLRFDQDEAYVRSASNAQVRRPLNTASIGRWRHYRAELADVLELLGIRDQGSAIGDQRSGIREEGRGPSGATG